MCEDASEFVRALSNNSEVVGFIPGGALGEVLRVWSFAHDSEGVLRVRLPYQPGRKDRQLASVLLQALGQPPLTQGVSTVKAWELVASLCRECDSRLVVIENADLLDKEGLAYVSRRYLPAVLLVGGERLAQRISQDTARGGRILSWGAANVT